MDINARLSHLFPYTLLTNTNLEEFRWNTFCRSCSFCKIVDGDSHGMTKNSFTLIFIKWVTYLCLLISLIQVPSPMVQLWNQLSPYSLLLISNFLSICKFIFEFHLWIIICFNPIWIIIIWYHINLISYYLLSELRLEICPILGS